MSVSLGLFSWDGNIPQERVFLSLGGEGQGLAASVSGAMWGRGWRLQHSGPQHSVCVPGHPHSLPGISSPSILSYPLQKINL